MGTINLLNRQLSETYTGGLPVLQRKLYTLLFLIPKYMVGSLNKFLINHKYSRAYVKKFFQILLKLTRYELEIIDDGKKIDLINAANLIDKDLEAAIQAYRLFVAENPNRSDGFFELSNALYISGNYPETIDKYIEGLKILDKKAETKNLNKLNIRFLGNSWACIGHLSLIDVTVKLDKLNLLIPEKRLIYMTKSIVPNPHYLEYWSKYIDITYIDDDEYRALRLFAREIFDNIGQLKLLKSGYTDLFSAWNLAENMWRDKQSPPLLELKKIDRERGLEVFDQLGIPRDSWFVTLHVREGDSTPVTRSNSNAKIDTYLGAIKTITDRGGWVIRMGHAGMTPLPDLPRVIDYANSHHKSDWMDVFLWASCRFLIGTGSGPLSVPPTFGRPVLYTNCSHIGLNVNFSNSLLLPKLFWSNKYNRLFTFRELLKSPMGWTFSRNFPGCGDCTIIDNSPEEIEAAVGEMLELTEKLTNWNDYLSDLQTKFNIVRNEYGDTGQMVISNTFINKYSELLR